MRLTIPRSQGKQAYYDARKSSWGDIFPHAPKNSPQVRFQQSGVKGQLLSGVSDFGKRRSPRLREQQSPSYDKLTSNLKESKKQVRREWRRMVLDD